LTAGLPFIANANPLYNTINVEFIQPIDKELLAKGLDLRISMLEEFRKDCDPEYEQEMFDGKGIGFDSDYT